MFIRQNKLSAPPLFSSGRHRAYHCAPHRRTAAQSLASGSTSSPPSPLAGDEVLVDLVRQI
jgi:hypothetical protein